MNPFKLLALQTSGYEQLAESRTGSIVLHFVIFTMLSWSVAVGSLFLKYMTLQEVLGDVFKQFLLERVWLALWATLGLWLLIVVLCTLVWIVLRCTGVKPVFHELFRAFLVGAPLVLFSSSLVFFVPLLTKNALFSRVGAIVSLLWSFAMILKTVVYSIDAEGSQTLVAVCVATVLTGVLGIIVWAIV